MAAAAGAEISAAWRGINLKASMCAPWRRIVMTYVAAWRNGVRRRNGGESCDMMVAESLHHRAAYGDNNHIAARMRARQRCRQMAQHGNRVTHACARAAVFCLCIRAAPRNILRHTRLAYAARL